MNLAYTATGRASGFLEKGIKAWDIAAGIILVREAGGYVCDYQGKGEMDLAAGEVIAVTCKELGQSIIACLK